MTRPYDAQKKWQEQEKRNRERQQGKAADSFTFKIGGDVFEGMFGAPAPKPIAPAPPPVTWGDIVGQTEAKAAVREAIEGATKHAALYKRYGRRPTKGILLFGPPGNGKTMLGKAAASALASQHGREAQESGFIYVKGPEVLDKYLGESERKVRRLFERAREHKARHGYPAIIFIDEAESILDHRRSHSMSSTIVPAFLAEMDGLVDTAAIVILATNRPGTLDSAIIREGRIDRKVLVGRPTREDAGVLIAMGLEGRPVEGDDWESVTHAAVAALYDSRNTLYQIHLRGGRTRAVTLGDFTSGAQIAYLVDAAAAFAIDREIATGITGGIRVEDFAAAIARTLREQRDLDHPTELTAYCETFVGDVVSLERVRADGVTSKRSLIMDVPEGMEVVFAGKPMAERVPDC